MYAVELFSTWRNERLHNFFVPYLRQRLACKIPVHACSCASTVCAQGTAAWLLPVALRSASQDSSAVQALKCKAAISAPEQVTSRPHKATTGVLSPQARVNWPVYPRPVPDWLLLARRLTFYLDCECSCSSAAQPCYSATIVSAGASKPGGMLRVCHVYFTCIPRLDQMHVLQGELDAGQSIAALRRFSDNLANLPYVGWGMCV